MARWSNWSGRHQARPRQLHFARSEEDVAALVAEAARSGLTIRTAGSGHSHAPLVPGGGIVLDVSGLCGVMATDRQQRTACIRAGTPIHALGRPLHDAGLALVNQGDIDRQTLAGACATGTHGTGVTLSNLSSAVVGMRLVTASGEILDCNPQHHAELWRAARLNLGAFGVVTALTLQLRDAYRLKEHSWPEPLTSLLPRLSELEASSRHFEFFWYPENDTAMAKAIEETSEPASYPLGAEGSRCAWSYEVLPNHRPHLHTEMEYSIPADAGPDCLSEIRGLIRRDFPQLRWPVEYRTLAADDVWLSPAYQRPSVTVSVHQDVREDERQYFAACEAVFLRYGGRPHWGKVHYLRGEGLAAAHPCWHAWWSARDAVDPDGVFLNEYLEGLRAPG